MSSDLPTYRFVAEPAGQMPYHLYETAEFSLTFHVDAVHHAVTITAACLTPGARRKVSACRVSFEHLMALAEVAGRIPAPEARAFPPGADRLAGEPVVALFPPSDDLPVACLCFSDEAWFEQGVYRGLPMMAIEVGYVPLGEDMREVARRHSLTRHDGN